MILNDRLLCPLHINKKEKAEKRIAELDELIKKLYEGSATGKIPDKHFKTSCVCAG